MEAYILLLLFFLGLPLAIYLVLSDPNKSTPSEQQGTYSQRNKEGAAGNIATYAVLTALLAFFCILTVLLQKNRT